jgi:hypothetical protein
MSESREHTVENEPDHAQSRAAHGSFLGRIMTKRLPLWTLLAAVLVAAAVGIGAYVARDVPDFGPAVRHSERVEVVVHICNDQVDAQQINPRAAELKLQDELRNRGAADASVTVERRDCPEDSNP